MTRTSFFIVEAKLGDRTAVWVVDEGLHFTEREGTQDSVMRAAHNVGFTEAIYNADQTYQMYGSRQQVKFMRKLVDRAWELAQTRFGHRDEKWSREIDINVALVKKYEGIAA